jgi:hypothetical protein
MGYKKRGCNLKKTSFELGRREEGERGKKQELGVL